MPAAGLAVDVAGTLCGETQDVLLLMGTSGGGGGDDPTMQAGEDGKDIEVSMGVPPNHLF